MTNFELDTKAKELSDSRSAYSLAREVVKLRIALKAQHQPHMDYIPQLDCTVRELMEDKDV